MFIARIVFFKLHESPRYLVHAGRHEEAAEALQLISKYNGSERQFAVEDVEDTVPAVPPEPDAERTAKSAHILEHSTDGLRDGSLDSVTYQTMDEPDVTLDAHRFGTPLMPDAPPAFAREAHPRPAPARRRSASTASMYVESKAGPVCGILPPWVRDPILAWVDRVAMVLSPEWLRMTVLVWGAWFGMSLGASVPSCALGGADPDRRNDAAYTMFNVYLPKLLETRSPSRDPGGTPKSLEESLWDVVIYSIGGCPGAVVSLFASMRRTGRSLTRRHAMCSWGHT